MTRSNRRRYLPRTIRAKIAAFFAVVVGLVSAFIFLYFPARLEQEETEALGRKAQSIGAMAAFAARSGVIFGDREAVNETLLGAMENTDLLYVAVVDSSGEVLGIQAAGGISANNVSRGVDIPVVPDAYSATVPIQLRGRQVGEVRLAISLQEIRTEVGTARRITAAVSAIVFLVALGAVLMISAYVTRPLRRMVRTAERIADGDLSERTDVASDDEVGHLATALNVMVGRLQQATSDLQITNQQLADEVEDRTHEWMVESGGRRRAEAERSELERSHEELLNVLPAQVAVFDAKGRLLYANPAGIDDPEVRRWAIGRTVGEYARRAGLTTVDSKPPWREVANACFRRLETVTFEQTIKCRDGRTRQYIRTMGPIAGGNGGGERFIGYGLDVTDLKAAEAALRESELQIRQAQKLEAVGQLAAGVAHDFNNILTVISGHGSLLLDLEEAGEVHDSASAVVSAVESATLLTRQLLAFSRKQVLQPENLDLN